GIAARDVVVVRVLVAPDEPEALVHLARERPRTDAQREVLVAAFLEHGQRKPVVRGISALLDEHVVLVRSLLDAHHPFAFRPAAVAREPEPGRRLSDGVRLEVALDGARAGSEQQARTPEGHKQRCQLHASLLPYGFGAVLGASAFIAVTSIAAFSPRAS